MRANRGMWMAAVAVAAAMTGHAEAADSVNEATVRRLVVSIPDRKLAVVENDAVVQVFAVAVGTPNTPSPIGTFTIVNRIANPTYYHPGKVIAPGPQNPLGTRWIGLNQKGYGIHGTDQPSSIGDAKSHGCIRLRNADVERLFERVRPGDVVELHAERTPELDLLFTSAR
jgi:lipoprotein-anchoring transpeptidase ErfK/SrfK